MFSLKKWLSIYFFICMFACVLVTLLPWWPSVPSLVIVKYIILFAPRWLLLLAILILFFMWNYLSRRQKYILPFLILISIKHLDIGMSLKNNSQLKQHDKVKIITANIGEGGKLKKLKLLLKYDQPDILLLQDANKLPLKKLPNDYTHAECVGELCIVSKYPFERTNNLPRALLGGWGNSAIFYKVFIGNITINVANVHFQSVHSLLIDIAKRTIDISDVELLEDNKNIEAGVLGSWLKNTPNSIIAGDFNMPVEDNIYHKYFSLENNALSDAGVGFNSTVKTYGLSLRIDHILFSKHFGIIDAQIIEPLGGDHIPVMATLVVIQ